MPTCQLCESSQPIGDACDVCGRPFAAGEAVALPVPVLPELETTRHTALPDVPISPLPDLEPTAQQDGGAALPTEPVDGFSPTAAEPVRVDAEPLEVERIGDDAERDRPSEPGPVACRYCRTPGVPGEHLCAVCGMRLPLVRPPPATAGAPERCRDCGMPMAGSRCPACGARRGIVH
jgi:hypothetical protein